jgi:hypothetical protein
LGPALGLLLQQRGWFPLHASAVIINGQAVAFAGNSESGKSTLAATLHGRGHNLVSDDITAVEIDADPPKVYPGYPWTKLWPDTVVALGKAIDAHPRIHAESDKRLSLVNSGFAASSAPLRSIYLLADADNENIERLSPQKRLLELLGLCFNVRLVYAAIGASEHMRRCSKLANLVPIYRLNRQRTLSAVSGLARMVEEHLARS